MTNEQELHKFYFEELNWCGCGNPEEVMGFMRDVLAAVAVRFKDADSNVYAVDENNLLPLDSPLALSYRYFLDGLELTEHGGNVCGAWLTDKGKHLLDLLKRTDLEGFTEAWCPDSAGEGR